MCLQYSFHTGGENGLSLRLSGLHTTIICQCAILNAHTGIFPLHTWDTHAIHTHHFPHWAHGPRI